MGGKNQKTDRFYGCVIQTVTLYPKFKPMKRNTVVSLWKICPALLLNLCSEDIILLEYAELIISIHLLDFNFIVLYRQFPWMLVFSVTVQCL